MDDDKASESPRGRRQHRKKKKKKKTRLCVTVVVSSVALTSQKAFPTGGFHPEPTDESKSRLFETNATVRKMSVCD
jgi:hypothetical protein